ncbi:hypothetical protein ASE67_16630 [Sphingomonas sp. Leaf23]|uniref:hypothetical protein n=1 Tax=Sphingomonas sp. Leaf23 TaxID=1735689 RepID=UPI0006FE9B43|nr:hypothetical protein [Sphingomonas sp. Leaf23]KQM81828.1 hypothetical protein ASE67_16630 [Sphingomonas sp. Leaf23]
MIDNYAQRLKRDRWTGWAVAIAVFAIVPSMVGITTILLPGSHTDVKVNPLYWLILAVPLPWTSALLSYRPGPLRWLRAALLSTPALALAVAGIAWASGLGITPYLYMIAVTAALCLAGLWAYPRSILAREGVPDANGNRSV